MSKFPVPYKYKLKNEEKYVGNVHDIWIRSSYERKFMMWCDLNPSVLKWGSEIYPIQYYCQIDKRVHRYFIDFFIQLKTANDEIKNIAIEIKPFAQTQMPVRGKKRERTFLNECLTYQKNSDKWQAAKKWAEQNDFEFQIMTEYELGLAKKHGR